MQEESKTEKVIGFLTDDEITAPSNYDDIAKFQASAKKRHTISRLLVKTAILLVAIVLLRLLELG